VNLVSALGMIAAACVAGPEAVPRPPKSVASPRIVTRVGNPVLRPGPPKVKIGSEIDNLLVSFQEGETVTQDDVVGEVVEETVPAPVPTLPEEVLAVQAVPAVAHRNAPMRPRRSVAKFMHRPIAASIVVLWIAAALQPGVGEMLQYYHHWNTTLVLTPSH